jgi:hypothetical protein
MVCTEKTFYQMYDGDKQGANHQIVATIKEAAIFIRNKLGDKKFNTKGTSACKQANRNMSH